MRHDLPTVLSPAVTRVLAGYRSPTTIWEHTTDLTGADLRSVVLGRISPFHLKSTIWRLLQDLVPADLVKPRVLWRLVYLLPVVAGCDCSWRWVSGAQAASCSAGVRIPMAECVRVVPVPVDPLGGGDLDGVGLDCWVFFGQCLFVFQAAFVKFRSSLSTSLGVRYPRAE